MSTRNKKQTVQTVETMNPITHEVSTVAVVQPEPTPVENNLTRLQAHQEAQHNQTSIVPWQNGTLKLVKRNKPSHWSFVQDALYQWMEDFTGKLIDALIGLEAIDYLHRSKTYASKDDNGVMTLRIAYWADWPVKDAKTGDVKYNDNGEIVMGKRWYLLTLNSKMEAEFDGLDKPLKSGDIDSSVKFMNVIDPSFALLQLRPDGTWKKVEKGNFDSIFTSETRSRHDEPNLFTGDVK